MATTITYATALSTIIDFAKANGFEDTEVLAKVEKLRDQKATHKTNGGKSKARQDNELLAQQVADAIRANSLDEVRASWVREHVNGINTVPKAVAVLNAGVDAGILKSRVVAKSATRNELLYSVA